MTFYWVQDVKELNSPSDVLKYFLRSMLVTTALFIAIHALETFAI